MVAVPAACLVFENMRMSMQLRQRDTWAREKKIRLYTGPSILYVMKTFDFPFSSHCPSQKSKAGGAGSCSKSVPNVAGVLTGVLTGVELEGCRVASPPGEVFP